MKNTIVLCMNVVLIVTVVPIVMKGSKMNESVFLLNGRYVISLYTEDMNVCSLILLHKDRSDTEWIKFKRIPYIWDNMYRKIYVAEVPTELFEKLIVPIPKILKNFSENLCNAIAYPDGTDTTTPDPPVPLHAI